MSDWISVEDRLPEEDEDVLGYVIGRNVDAPAVVFYWSEEEGWFSNGARDLNVTHWQPLPDAPEDKK